jgi:YlmC/YmxH family sporulation protein
MFTFSPYIYLKRKFTKGEDIVVKISDFQIKDVINVANGKKLGNISDLEISMHTGKIESIVLHRNTRMLSFLGREEDIVIPWQNIVKIGEDVVLVRYNQIGPDTESSSSTPSSFYS